MQMKHLHLRAWNAEKGDRDSRPMELQDATPLREEPSLSEELCAELQRDRHTSTLFAHVGEEWQHLDLAAMDPDRTPSANGPRGGVPRGPDPGDLEVGGGMADHAGQERGDAADWGRCRVARRDDGQSYGLQGAHLASLRGSGRPLTGCHWGLVLLDRSAEATLAPTLQARQPGRPRRR